MTREECGRLRYEARYAIRAVLVERGLSMSELGRRIGVTAELVSATVRGKRHSPKVLDALRRKAFRNNTCLTHSLISQWRFYDFFRVCEDNFFA